jgi:hypothetical protein
MPIDRKKYYITYRVEHHPEGLTKEEVEAQADGFLGACHNLVGFSIIGTPGDGGPMSVLPFGKRGEDGEPLSAAQQWTLWLMWATRLSKEEGLDPFKREACAAIVDAARRAMGITPPATTQPKDQA